MKCSLGISDFLEEISSLSHSIVFLYFFALFAEEAFLSFFLFFFFEEGFLISPCYSLELCIPGSSVVKNPPATQELRRCGFDSWVGKIPWRMEWQLTPVFLLGESHGQRTMAGYSPWGCWVRHDWTTWHTHTLSTCFTWESTSPTPPSAPFHGISSLYFVDLIFLKLEYVGIPPIAICSYSSRFPEEKNQIQLCDIRKAILT